MPRSEVPHAAVLDLPAGLGAREEVLVCRYTGEIFRDYEDYIKQQSLYRQRVWSCKYSGSNGLTYEEAVASEDKVAAVVDQFPALYEEAALRLVHHSTEPAEQLASHVLSHFENSFVVGEELLGEVPGVAGRSAPCVVRAASGAAAPAPAGLAAAGGEAGGDAAADSSEAGGGAAAVKKEEPEESGAAGPEAQQQEQAAVYEVEWLAAPETDAAAGEGGPPPGERATLGREALARRQPSPLASLTPQLLRKWLETVAWAEPVTGVPGVDCVWHANEYFREKHGLPEQLPADMAERLRPSRQKALLKVPSLQDAERPGVEFVDTPYDEEGAEEGEAGLEDEKDKEYAFGEDDRQDDYEDDEDFESDDEYRPMHPGVEGRGRGRGRLPARTPRGRGRGRRPMLSRLMHSPPAPPPPGAPHPPPPPVHAADMQLLVESIEEVERRLQPGSIKHGVFTVLRDVGDAGLTINDIVDKMSERGLKAWEDPKQGRNSVASTCGHDPAFVRVGTAKFALRALCSPQQLLPEDSVSMDQLDEGAQRQLALVGQQQKDALRRLAEEAHKPKVERNNFKCPKCHRTTHVELSPLLLCDTCPRAYHLACLGLEWRDLPSDDWCCPKCVESTQAALRRVMDLEARKKEALERAAHRGKEAEDKLLRRLLQKEERERRRLETGPGAAKGKAIRIVPDDWEVLQEERENLGRLEVRRRELDEVAARHPLPEGGIEFADPETAAMHQRAAETREALSKLHDIISGPPTFGPLMPYSAPSAAAQEAQGAVGPPGSTEQAALGEALSLAEFLRIFGEACVAPILGAQQLFRAAAWPLDSPDLPALYSSMLQCCLLEQMNHEPPAKGRARRWSRMLTSSDGVWPELLRRYLAVTRSKVAAAKVQPFDPTKDPLLMDDDEVALFAAEHLSRAPWWELPAGAHLRLLSVLCYDTAQGYRLRAEINARQADTVKIQTERYREQTGKKGTGKRGADASELGAGGGGGKKRKGKKGSSAQLAEPTDEEIEEALAEMEAELEGEEGELDEAALARRRADAEFDARLQARASRTEPLGLDRYHRRYWWLRSGPGAVFVENPDGKGPMGAIRTKEQLDEVMNKLNRRGPRESGLHRGLRRRYAAITASMAAEEDANSYLLSKVPRPPPEDSEQGQKSVEELARKEEADGLAEAKDKLELFITETQDIGVQMSCELREIRRQLRVVESPQQLCDFLLVLESFLGTAGEGLPAGADNVSIAPLLGEAPPLAAAPSSTALDIQDTAQGGRPAGAAAPAAAPAVKQEPAAAPGGAQQAQQAAEGSGEAAGMMDIDEGSGANTGEAEPGAGPGAAPGVKEEGPEAGLGHAGESAGAAGSAAAAEPAGPAAKPLGQAPHGLVLPEMPPVLEGTYSNAAALPAVAAAPAAPPLGKPPLPPAAPGPAAGGGAGAAPAPMDEDGDAQHAQHVPHRPLLNSDSLLGGETSSLPASTITGEEQTQGTGADAEDAALKPVGGDDDLEDSDAEHAFLREKRMRRPARLWRSARERAVWVKLTREAGGQATKACYAAFLLRDRAGPMLQRFINIADEQARWEAEEAERQRIEKAESKKRASAGGEDGPPERPLMIRTGKAKTEDGVRIVLKAMGKTPFAMGRGASSIDVVATPEQVAACRWGYQCSVCLLAGDLLCCEHPDGCNVSCHPECTGMGALPKGPYVCMNHDSRELKTRIRRRASSSLPRGGEEGEGDEGDDDDEATVSEDTQTAADSEATEDEAPRSRSTRKRPRRS